MVVHGTGLPFGSDGDTLGTVNFPTDANFTMQTKAADAFILKVTSLVNLTATRNLVVPLTKGACFLVFNNTSGAQSIQIISSSGTGITIATAKTAFVYCDGTNWLRGSADV